MSFFFISCMEMKSIKFEINFYFMRIFEGVKSSCDGDDKSFYDVNYSV
jgi:hypothetical protein